MTAPTPDTEVLRALTDHINWLRRAIADDDRRTQDRARQNHEARLARASHRAQLAAALEARAQAQRRIGSASMRPYVVRWETLVDQHDEVGAAAMALEIMRSAESEALEFRVKLEGAPDNQFVTVDLSPEDEDGCDTTTTPGG